VAGQSAAPRDPKRGPRRSTGEDSGTIAMALEDHKDAETAAALKVWAARWRALSRVAWGPSVVRVLEGLAQQLDGEAGRRPDQAAADRSG
jgi:hypothetical protein